MNFDDWGKTIEQKKGSSVIMETVYNCEYPIVILDAEAMIYASE